MNLFPSTCSADEDLIARLENDLRASRDSERQHAAAVARLRRELQEALLTIAGQEKRLALLAKKLQPNHRAAGARELPTDGGTAFSKFALLMLPDKPGYASVAERIPPAVNPPVCLRSNRDNRAAQRVESLWKSLPSWATGTLSPEDECFLDAMIDRLRPDRVYEIGVASGSSSAFILNSMAAYADPSRIWLHSYDIAEKCYFDPAYAVGDATRVMVPGLLKHWKLNAGQTVLDVPRETEARSLYFIDADHSHPAPTLDLIALLSRLKPGDHVILHDINLPRLFDGKFPDAGAHWLFDDWTGPRFASDAPIPNIGTIVIPEDKNLVRTSLTKTLSRPWANPFPNQDAYLSTCEQRLLEFLAGS